MKLLRMGLAVAAVAILAGVAYVNQATGSSADKMAAAAEKFLGTLSDQEKAKATFDFSDKERLNWHFIPRERKGLPLKELRPDQAHLASALLGSGLSQRGYLKATTIMSLEQVLLELEKGSGPARDPQRYYVSIFGTPDARGTWGWRFEGHHLSVNFTIVDGRLIAGTPSFLASNPAEVREGSRKGLRVLAAEEDLGRALVKSLNAKQRAIAIITNVAPKDILTGADRSVKPLPHGGLAASQLKSEQRDLLRRLIEEYVRRHRADLADAELKKIDQAGFHRIQFAWAGGLERGEGHYYSVQGPTFLLEYDNTQNNANHVHSVWRDFENDFGVDLLRRHYDQHHR